MTLPTSDPALPNSDSNAELTPYAIAQGSGSGRGQVFYGVLLKLGAITLLAVLWVLLSARPAG
ncbi:MAG TPA: hypothetical protein V6D06_15250 [Trichocoleus sp.]